MIPSFIEELKDPEAVVQGIYDKIGHKKFARLSKSILLLCFAEGMTREEAAKFLIVTGAVGLADAEVKTGAE